MVLCFAVFHEQDLLIRRHTSCCCLLEPSCQHFLCWLSWVVFFWFLFVLFGFCFACGFFVFGFASSFVLTRLRTVMVWAPLSNPQRGIQCMHMRNLFNQHNNVRRPGESHRGAGRKKVSWRCCLFRSPNEGDARLAQFVQQFVQLHKHCVTTWREPRRR